MFLASQRIFSPRGRWCELSPQLSPELSPELSAAWRTVKDPPTQAVENILPLQRTPDMHCSWAAADTEMASPAKCIQTHAAKIHAVLKNGAVGGRFATVYLFGRKAQQTSAL